MTRYRLSICTYTVGFILAIVPGQLVRSQYDGAVPPPEPIAPGFDSITKEQSEAWLSILAGPGFEGRGTGQLGYVRAAHWVAGKVAEFGLEPMGEGGTYFQMLPMSKQSIEVSQSKLLGPEGLVIPFSKNLGLDRFVNEAEVSGKIVFVKVVGDNPRFEDNLLQGKIVIYTTDAKNESRGMFLFSRQRPAAALRVVTTEPKSTSQLKRSSRGPTLHSGTISLSAATLLANAAGISTDWLSVKETDTSGAIDADAKATLQMRVREESVAVPNVLAWQPGSDPSVNSEYIVVGAHLDHLGIQGGVMYPGADDNGSGSTALLNIAKAVASNPVKPKRSVLFMWFAAEEMGLVGSAHYTENPVLPLEKMICMLNVDMVGRNEEKGSESASDNENTLHLVGSQKGDKTLHEVILDSNKHVNLVFEFDEEGVFGRSDQANFFKKGTSVAFLFGGFHPDYHRPTDEPAKINYKKIAAAAKLFYVTIHRAADHGFFKIPTETQEKKPEEKPADTPKP